MVWVDTGWVIAFVSDNDVRLDGSVEDDVTESVGVKGLADGCELSVPLVLLVTFEVPAFKFVLDINLAKEPGYVV